MAFSTLCLFEVSTAVIGLELKDGGEKLSTLALLEPPLTKLTEE